MSYTLSSGVIKSPDYTMEQMIGVLQLLRRRHDFWGYIHAKAIPGASPELVRRLGLLADRISVNVELPSEQSLRLLAPDKKREAIVAPLLKAEKHLLREAHLLQGFVRFADVGGPLVAVITPKNYILPFIAEHFAMRYDREQFMIFDKTNKAALVYREGKAEILRVDHVEFPKISVNESRYHALWKRFYDTIAIESRINPRCRMTHMPKRYWENMLEVSDL